MTYHVVSTMNAEGWARYGRRMAESFVARWPASARLTVYAEGFDPDIDGIDMRRLPDWIEPFKLAYKGVPLYHGRAGAHYDFRFDLVKFAHKVAAMTDFGLRLPAGDGADDAGVMIWLDADIVFHADVTEAFLAALFPPPSYIAWLERQGGFPETGFVMFRAGHAAHRGFMASLLELYLSGDVTGCREFHDAFVIWDLAKQFMAKGLIEKAVNLSGDAWRTSHPAINGPLGSVLDHMKGPRKDEGMSRRRDIVMPRSEDYWKAAR